MFGLHSESTEHSVSFTSNEQFRHKY